MSAASDRRVAPSIVIAVLVGCALRLARPEVHSLWIDEGMTVLIARADDPFALLRHDSHPPLSFLLFRGWIALFGESDLALRALPALVSCAALVAFARLAREWLGRERATAAVAVYAAAPLLVWYAHEVRMYGFVEAATLAVLFAARAAWRAPSAARWIVLALATAVATGLHYYGAFAGLVVVLQALASRRPLLLRTAVATSAGVLAWTPWLVDVLPDQRHGAWPVIVQASPRDLLELPARLVAVDFSVLLEHGLTLVAWILAAVCVAGFLVGAALAFARRDEGERDATIAALAPIAAAGALVFVAGSGIQPRYVTTAIPGAIATIAIGLYATRARALGHVAATALVACAATTTVLQLSENRREDYRAAAAEIVERWRPGDRLLLLVCVPEASTTAALEHYLRERPEILAARLDASRYEAGVDRPPSGTRIHVVWREATLCWAPFDRLARTHELLERSPGRFRIHRVLTVVP